MPEDERLRKLMRRFDETSTQLVAVMMIVVLVVLLVLSHALISREDVNWEYAVQSAAVLVICNICLFINLCPRLVAIWKGDQLKYIQRGSLEDGIAEYLEATIKEFKAQNSRKFVAVNSTSSIDISALDSTDFGAVDT